MVTSYLNCINELVKVKNIEMLTEILIKLKYKKYQKENNVPINFT